MLMNLSEVFTSEGNVLKEQVIPEIKEITVFEEEHDVTDVTPLELTAGYLSNGKAYVRVQGQVSFELCCDRCLQPVSCDVPIMFEQDVYAPDALPEDMDAEEQNFMEGYQLNIETLVSNEIIMNWPMKVLCKPDCKGICLKCGQNLNLGDCGCDTFVPDPRMAVIKEIFSANKEV